MYRSLDFQLMEILFHTLDGMLLLQEKAENMQEIKRVLFCMKLPGV